jgi:hypothetical protein
MSLEEIDTTCRGSLFTVLNHCLPLHTKYWILGGGVWKYRTYPAEYVYATCISSYTKPEAFFICTCNYGTVDNYKVLWNTCILLE